MSTGCPRQAAKRGPGDDSALPDCVALLLVPTRELASQVVNLAAELGDPMKVRCHALVGGNSVRGDIRALGGGKAVVVGNPGRVYDMINRRHLNAEHLKLFVLDEADVLLSGVFMEQSHNIFRTLPPKVQCACFSTLLPAEVVQTMYKFLCSPLELFDGGDKGTMPSNLHHFCVCCKGNKTSDLCGPWSSIVYQAPSCIVFCNSKFNVEKVGQRLGGRFRGQVGVLHGDMVQEERSKVMRQFTGRFGRGGKTRILVCTPDFGRGLHAPRVALVVNHDLPATSGEFLLRAGRCGRLGATGVTLTLAQGSAEVKAMRRIARDHDVNDPKESVSVADISRLLPPLVQRKHLTGDGQGSAGA